MPDVRSRSFVLACALLLILGFSSACGGGSSSPTEPEQPADRFIIQSLSPPLGTTLSQGITVDFSVTAQYQIRAGISEATLAVMDQEGNILAGAGGPQVRILLNGRTGTFTVSNRVTLPTTDLTRVRVRVSLLALEQPQGGMWDEREYEVD
ncbi:MAG: hypothetical protein ACLGI9_04155 [Thermoanaerobaculia bacterium]